MIRAHNVFRHCKRQGITVSQECDDAWEFTAPAPFVFSTEAKTRVVVIDEESDWQNVIGSLALFTDPARCKGEKA